MVKQVKGCCCCLSLKTGTIIIGIVGVLWGLLVIGVALDKPQPLTDEDSELASILDRSLSFGGKYADSTLETVLEIMMALLEITMSVVLIIGAIQGRPKWVFCWIVLNVVVNGLGIIVLTTTGVYLMVTGMVKGGLVILITTLILSSVQAYLILVVNSFHMTILPPPSYEHTMFTKPIMVA